jgi:hypothetical protein
VTLPDPTIHRHQLDGSKFGRYNCMAAVGAMALDAYTDGELRPSSNDVRRNQPDQAGGISVRDLADAWEHYGQKLTHGRMSWESIVDRLADGNGCVVTVDYGDVPDRYSSQDSYDDDHALYLSRLAGEAGIVVWDPLAQAPRVWPRSVVENAYRKGPGEAAFGAGVYARPARPTHRTRTTHVRLRVRPNIPSTIAAVLVRAGGLVRVEGTVQGSWYRLSDGRSSNKWHRIVARGSGGNARRLATPLYSAALLWRPI